MYRDFTNPFYRFYIGNKPVESIPNEIDTDMFYPSNSRREAVRSALKFNSDDFIILIASRLHKQKRIYQAVTAFFSYPAKDSKSRLLILGGGPETKNINHLLHNINLSEVVSMPGSASIDQLPQYHNEDDVSVFSTSHEEGLPLLPLESLASGIPVIASDHLLEITKCGDSSEPVNPRCTESIVNGIKQSKTIISNAESLLPAKYWLE